MAQKFYAASSGDHYLTLSDEPGKVTDSLIVGNIVRMMEMDDEVDENTSWRWLRAEARDFYEENIDKILSMAHTNDPLVEITAEEAEELQGLSFQEWKAWEFADAEWD